MMKRHHSTLHLLGSPKRLQVVDAHKGLLRDLLPVGVVSGTASLHASSSSKRASTRCATWAASAAAGPSRFKEGCAATYLSRRASSAGALERRRPLHWRARSCKLRTPPSPVLAQRHGRLIHARHARAHVDVALVRDVRHQELGRQVPAARPPRARRHAMRLESQRPRPGHPARGTRAGPPPAGWSATEFQFSCRL